MANKENTMAKQDAFIAAYGECGSVKAAAEASQVSRATVYDWISKDLYGFKDKMAVAREIFREMLQDMAVERVKSQKPNDNPVLLITLLNAHWAEKYRRDSQTTNTSAKEIMQEWQKWVSDNKQTSKDNPKISEAEQQKQNAINEVEKILSRKKNDNS